MDRLNVLYDISVLGTACVQNRSRTGIFRVVDNIAAGLVEAQGIDTVFCALESICECDNLIKSSPRFANVPFTPVPLGLAIGRRKEELRKKSQNAVLPVKVTLKAAAELLRLTSRIVKRFEPTIPPSYLRHCDIFHSPYLPIPRQVKEFRNVSRFLTVYDIIALQHPEFFTFKEDHHMIKSVIDSIDPETWVLSISQATKDDLCSYRKDIDPARVIVTPLAASDIFYPNHDGEELRRVRRKYGIPESPYILSLSTLEPRKNIDQTVRCFTRMIQQEHLPDLNLVLVGTKGWNYDKIFEEILSNREIRDRIIVTGYADDDDLAAIYSGARAFVYPSFYEGFGLPPLEAMQCGVPVITSNTSSLPEVVGDAGILVAPTDSDGLCHAMLTICRDRSLRQSLSVKAQQRAKQFSWESCLAKTVEAYRLSCSS
jgi:glycosyltransferase involved in cell wall biosynthesis